ncbi:putative histone deactylase [Cyclospora cayetanensis]|uniref:Histone deactylase n=1 Tax=Cyclospora cayetanensis TaxID=88456 RepID=A0A1D3D4C7_9EIME|nr:putative histone deactylase [Cyclospora cayetanensis]
MPALHILVGRSSFAEVRADAAECLRRLLYHAGLLYAASGGSRVCSRCTLTSTRSRDLSTACPKEEARQVQCGAQDRSVECLLLLLAHSFPEDCFLWCVDSAAETLQRQEDAQRLVVGSAAAEAAVSTEGALAGGAPPDVRAFKRVVLQRAERRPLLPCACSSSLVYRIARRCLLHEQQLRELLCVARRSGCLQLFLATVYELVDAEPSMCSVAKAVFAEAGKTSSNCGAPPTAPQPVYVQQRCSSSNRTYRIPEGSGTLLATHESCMRHLPLPEPSDFPVKRFKLMQRFPENPSRLEVLVQPSSGVLKAAEFRHLDWIDSAPPASLADILRVHDVSYIFKLKQKIRSTFGTSSVKGPSGGNSAVGPTGLDKFAYSFADGDTPVTALSWEAATCAAGTVIAAVDAVCTGARVNAFCAVRPPGHHLGSWGAAQTAPYSLTDEDIAAGSQGFCVLNNVAIGAAYARYNYAQKGIRRIAIVDFDAHHGNGTEQIIRNVGLKFRKLQGGTSEFVNTRTYPKLQECNAWSPAPLWTVRSFDITPLGSAEDGGGSLHDFPVQLPMWLGWRDESDQDELFFASIHAFDGSFYPGTGNDCEDFSGPTILNVTMPVHDACFTPVEGSAEGDSCCHCRRCRLPHRSVRSRLLFKERVLKRLDAFKPDLIFLSAGFDGHIKDPIGGEAVGWTEDDFYWLTMQVQRAAHRHCSGRCISVLEGGYNVRGGVISPLALCVREHVRALVKAAHMRLETHAKPRKTQGSLSRVPEELIAQGASESHAPRHQEASSPLGDDRVPAGRGEDALEGFSGGEEEFLVEDESDSGFSSSDDEAEAFFDAYEAVEGGGAPFQGALVEPSEGPLFVADGPGGSLQQPVVSLGAAMGSPSRAGVAGSPIDSHQPMSGGPLSYEGVQSPSAISSVSEDSAAAGGGSEASPAVAVGVTHVGAPGDCAGPVAGSHAEVLPSLYQQQGLMVLTASTSASEEGKPQSIGLGEPPALEEGEVCSKAVRLRYLCGFPV